MDDSSLLSKYIFFQCIIFKKLIDRKIGFFQKMCYYLYTIFFLKKIMVSSNLTEDKPFSFHRPNLPLQYKDTSRDNLPGWSCMQPSVLRMMQGLYFLPMCQGHWLWLIVQLTGLQEVCPLR